MLAKASIIAQGRQVIETEAQGLKALANSLGSNFEDAVKILTACKGRVILSGMGKSGHIAAKIAATMASTGTPAFAIHPGEASHGDLGMVADGDVLIVISNSGNSQELNDLIRHAARQDLPLIGISKNIDSAVGKSAQVFLALPDVVEACSLRLAPTTSTTMTLALGDALAVALMEEKGFQPADFHKFHPGGKLGLELMSVEELMRPADQVPRVAHDASMSIALEAMNTGKLGLIALMNGETLAGLITDGDIRRSSHKPLIEQSPKDIMTAAPIHMAKNARAVDALHLMNEKSITALIIRDEAGQFCGLLHIHELLRAGLT